MSGHLKYASDSFVGEGLNPTPYREMVAENERLRAEVERLREALNEIESAAYNSEDGWVFEEIAKEALKSSRPLPKDQPDSNRVCR